MKERLKTIFSAFCAILVLMAIWVFYVGCVDLAWIQILGNILDKKQPTSSETGVSPSPAINDIKLPETPKAKQESNLPVDTSKIESKESQTGQGGTQSTGQPGGHTN